MATVNKNKQAAKKKAPAKKQAGSSRVTPKRGVTSLSDWKGNTQPIELEVPSGNIALVRRPKGIQEFILKGQIPNALMPIVEAALDTKQGHEEFALAMTLKSRHAEHFALAQGETRAA